jgi:DNA-directed RNA polymerase subunit M/transcription elongation factor TFIIS
MSDASDVAQRADEQAPTIFRCQHCRRVLFTSTDLIPHEASKVRKFSGKRQQFSDDKPCTSHYIEKPDWLDATKRRADTIQCPKCKYKVGHFSWIGSQCSCGEWVKPSFQIAKSRVDTV